MRQLPWGAFRSLNATISCMLVQTGSGQSLVTRALVISLLNRIKVCLAPTLPQLSSTITPSSLCPYVILHMGDCICEIACVRFRVMLHAQCMTATQ
jgi:hypothetical protein